MYKLIIFVIFVSGAFNYSTGATDYCDKRLCTDYQGRVRKHIACDNNESFDTRCSPDAKIVPMTNELKELILERFNYYRNLIASGNMSNFEPAVDMTQMEWDDELSSLAELNVKQCTMQHDKCHNTDKYPYSGQNLGSSWTSETAVDPKSAFLTHIKRWFDENNDCDQSVIDKYRSAEEGIQWGHFTAMVNHKSNRIGCAASQYVPTSSPGSKLLMACNFSYTNLQGEPVYVKGTPCSKCRTGCSAEYPALCSKSEVINYLPDM